MDNRSKALDFDFLRQEGIRLLQKMSGTEWTDYNLHDPGVTILEYLCYALTDLAYRTNFDFEDLIAQPDGSINYQLNSFIKPYLALSSRPVTINDFRKLLIDKIPEVENIWIAPIRSKFSKNALKGLYKFYVQVNIDHVKPLSEGKLNRKLKRDVQKLFVAHRNLCEDASDEVHILQPENIVVNANLIIAQDTLPENVVASVYYTIEKFLNPTVRFYTEQELLNKDLKLDEIYTGPLLDGGFIPDDELRPRTLTIDPLELIKRLSLIKGVTNLNGLQINGRSTQSFTIDEANFPYFNIETSKIQLFRDGIIVSIKPSLVEDILHNLREMADKRYVHSFNKIHPKEITGNYRASDYHSLQRIFPVVYGIGEEGLSGQASVISHAHAKQLKAYLAIFEQVMANYLAQMGNLNGLFSNLVDQNISRTYYGQQLHDIPDFSTIIADNDSNEEGRWKSYFDHLSSTSYSDFLTRGVESQEDCVERKNKMLDHLLARFNEALFTYPIEQYDKLYGKNNKSLLSQKQLIWKSEMLRHITELSEARSFGFNYLDDLNNGEDYDFRKKMYRLLYIHHHTADSLLAVFNQNLKVEKVVKYVPSEFEVAFSMGPEEIEEMVDQSSIRKITTLSFKEYQEIVNSGKLTPYPEEGMNGSTIFREQPVSFLKHALDIDNYRFANDPQHQEMTLLLYKDPELENWLTVNRYENYSLAVSALDELLNLFIKISADSEGFYLVEHILLRPRVVSKNFGFRFYNEMGICILERSPDLVFQEREDEIEALLALNEKMEGATLDQLMDKILGHYTVPTIKVQNTSFFTSSDFEKAENLIHCLKQYRIQGESENCYFEMTVRQDEKVIVEDHFSFKLSIILPEWPARFQDESFRKFVKDLFHIQLPMHLRPVFYWLNIQQMPVFEEIYFSWLKELKTNSDANERMSATNLNIFLNTCQSDDAE